MNNTAYKPTLPCFAVVVGHHYITELDDGLDDTKPSAKTWDNRQKAQEYADTIKADDTRYQYPHALMYPSNHFVFVIEITDKHIEESNKLLQKLYQENKKQQLL